MRLATVVLFMLAGTIAKAQVADGVYEFPACTAAPVSDGRIQIADGEIRFYESTCQLGAGKSVDGLDGALIHAATCTGEGETWGMTILLMPGFDGGLIRVESGLALTYAACD